MAGRAYELSAYKNHVHFATPLLVSFSLPYSYHGKLRGGNSSFEWTDSCFLTNMSSSPDACQDSSSSSSSSSLSSSAGGGAEEESASWLFLMGGHVVFGLGSAAIGPFSISYIDDAANPINAPVYLGVLFTIAVFGPAVGQKIL